jgi:exodeoxyribonuclease VII large subunit
MAEAPKQVLSVSELTRQIKGLLADRFPSVWVEGEVSNASEAASGHVYFTLKDANAQLSVVVFRNVAGKLAFKLKDGLQVIVAGEIGVYERRGQYQLVATRLMPKGLGALQLAFEELKQRLAKEGLFDPARKRALPALPRRIGLVTSPRGAAIRDFLNIIGRRYPNLHIIINPVRVQGEGAAAEIAAAVDEFNALRLVDVIIVTRGGGSLEDLWAFNEEVVARALARSQIPTISAVGHEIDFTISDFVADLRAPTPSAAAELVVKAKDEYATALAQYRRQLDKDLRLRIGEARHRLQELAASEVLRLPAELIRQYQQQVDDLRHRLAHGTTSALEAEGTRLDALSEKFRLLSPQTMIARWQERLAASRQRLGGQFERCWRETTHRLETARTRLDLLSPNSTLARGYSITRLADTGAIVRSATGVTAGIKLNTMVLDGQFDSVVTWPFLP